MTQGTHERTKARQNSLPRPRAPPVTTQTCTSPDGTGEKRSPERAREPCETRTLPSIENSGSTRGALVLWRRAWTRDCLEEARARVARGSACETREDIVVGERERETGGSVSWQLENLKQPRLGSLTLR